MILAVEPGVASILAAVVAALGLFAGGWHRSRTVDRAALEQSDYHQLMEECRKLRAEQIQANAREVEASRRELNLERQLNQLQDQVAAQAREIEQLKTDSKAEIDVLKQEVKFWRDRALSGGQQP